MSDAAGGRLLIVDDDNVVRAMLVQALTIAGFEVLEASDGPQALSLLASESVDAVLLDNHMPGMSGLEVVASLRSRAQTRTLPIILVTGASDVADRVRGLEAGANDYLVKPVELPELVARVKAQLRGQAVWMRLLEGQLRERSTVTEALCRLRPERTPELTADLVCAELSRLRNLDGAAIVAFTDDGGAVPLARHGRVSRAVRVGLPLPGVLAQRLRSRAAGGAWTEHRASQPAGADGPPLLGPGTVAAAYAPLVSQGTILGLLALSTGTAAEDAPTDETAQALSAAIDFAAVSSALLGPALRRRFELRTTQSELQQILDTGGFTPVFQPIVDLRTGAVVGYETLTRFADGTDPQRRFSEAARIGMNRSLERATMAAALEVAGDRLGNAWLSVNVSPDFLSAGGPADLSRGAGCDLVLELTEHDPVDDYEGLHRALERLGSQVRLSIDDAGAGYACLTHVLALQPAFVKLDRGWVMGIDTDPARQALVAGLGSFAARTGSTLIAEGVETRGELETLQGLDVALGQGFLLGRPVPVSQLAGAV